MKYEPRNILELAFRHAATQPRARFRARRRAAAAPSAPAAGSADNTRFRAKAAHPFGRHNAQHSRPALPTRSSGCAGGTLKENTRILLTPLSANLPATGRGLVLPRALWSKYHSNPLP